jgi:hypothetical protein
MLWNSDPRKMRSPDSRMSYLASSPANACKNAVSNEGELPFTSIQDMQKNFVLLTA